MVPDGEERAPSSLQGREGAHVRALGDDPDVVGIDDLDEATDGADARHNFRLLSFQMERLHLEPTCPGSARKAIAFLACAYLDTFDAIDEIVCL